MPGKYPAGRTALALSPATRLLLADNAPIGGDGRNPSPSLAADLAIQSYYGWIGDAWQRIEGRFTASDLALVMQALSGTYIEPTLISCLADELRDAFRDEPDNDRECEPWPTAEHLSLIERVSALTEIETHALVCAARRQYAVRRESAVQSEDAVATAAA